MPGGMAKKGRRRSGSSRPRSPSPSPSPRVPTGAAAGAAAAAPSAGATGVTVLAVPLLSAVLLLLLWSAPGGLLLLCPACPTTSVPERCPASSAEWEQLQLQLRAAQAELTSVRNVHRSSLGAEPPAAQTQTAETAPPPLPATISSTTTAGDKGDLRQSDSASSAANASTAAAEPPRQQEMQGEKRASAGAQMASPQHHRGLTLWAAGGCCGPRFFNTLERLTLPQGGERSKGGPPEGGPGDSSVGAAAAAAEWSMGPPLPGPVIDLALVSLHGRQLVALGCAQLCAPCAPYPAGARCA